MIEFFNSIWTWIVQNTNEIVVTLTSANFVSFITSIVLLVKTIKSTKENTTSTNKLNDNILKVEELNKLNEQINIKLEELNKVQVDIDNKLIELQRIQEEQTNISNLTINKLNAILEAQMLVWSTIKDDNIRTNVNNILTTAKLKETTTINDMKEKLEELKNKLIAKTEELSQYVKNSEIKEVTSKEVNSKEVNSKEVKQVIENKIKNTITRV